jgi:D-tyrosyl-tRNA(Tyr) deacylase
MIAVIQRVSNASVQIRGGKAEKIGKGLVILLGIAEDDDSADVDYLVRKIVQMRIFADEQDKMNLSLIDIGGEILVVSQFTLFADTRKGNRPSFIRAARPEQAIPLYEYFILRMNEASDRQIATGEFGAMMDVSLVNDGPVTIILNSNEK